MTTRLPSSRERAGLVDPRRVDPARGGDGRNATASGSCIGYMRQSRRDDDPAQQVAALKQAGCTQLFEDRDATPAGARRPGLEAALSAVGRGDTLVVWRLDRLGQSLAQLVEIMDELAGSGIRFRSLSEGIDTGSAEGRRVHQIMAALAESERSLISERTRAGMQEAQAQGRPIGRRPALSEAQKQAIREAVVDRGEPLTDVASHYGVHSRTIRRALDLPARRKAATAPRAPGRKKG